MNTPNNLIRLLKDYEICIPIIQRDYAQGRTTEQANTVRKNLIGDIKNCLEDRNKNIDFNFVYGTINENEKIFYPVDGQQRLTTLYLLHWYLACNYKESDFFTSTKSFSYMTRNSASEFFAKLKEPEEQLKDLVQSGSGLREKIEIQSWFQIEWRYDPTVKACLTLLDDLSKDTDFRTKSESYYKRLEEDAITFTFINEEGENSEKNAAKSYIRMNARGKTLAPFENLKAMIDSIDNKLPTNPKLTAEYDGKYIHSLYKSSENSTLEEKTEDINQKSLNCFKNLYNLCLSLEKKEVINSDSEFISKIYGDSQRSLKDAECVFYKKYFKMIIAVFNYYEKNAIGISEIFETIETFSVENNREIIANVLYIYHKSLTDKLEIEKYLDVLKNLKYEQWNNYLTTIDNFSKAIALKNDVYAYFNNTKLDDVYNNFNDVSLPDIKVRLKEQKIKIEIISENELDGKYFNELEERFPTRKIQYLLHITGYWNKTGDYQKLSCFIEIAKTHFKPNTENENLEWCKMFAIAVNLDSNNNLLPYDEINQNAGKEHIWSDDFYFWNDSEDKDLANAKPLLEQIKKAYTKIEDITKLITKLPTEQSYDTCWLKYAVKYNSIELLNKHLEYDSSQVVVLSSNKKRYDMHVLKTIKSANYKLADLSQISKTQYVFDKEKEDGYKKRDFKMRLHIIVNIQGINEKHKNQEDYCLHSKCDNNYTIYEFISPYCYNEFEYDITNIVAKQYKKINVFQRFLNIYFPTEKEATVIDKNRYVTIRANKDLKWHKKPKSTSIWERTSKPVIFNGTPTKSEQKL